MAGDLASSERALVKLENVVSGVHQVISGRWWFVVVALTVPGCLDPLVEDPSNQGGDAPIGVAPILPPNPVTPGAPAGSVTPVTPEPVTPPTPVAPGVTPTTTAVAPTPSPIPVTPPTDTAEPMTEDLYDDSGSEFDAGAAFDSGVVSASDVLQETSPTTESDAGAPEGP